MRTGILLRITSGKSLLEIPSINKSVPWPKTASGVFSEKVTGRPDARTTLSVLSAWLQSCSLAFPFACFVSKKYECLRNLSVAFVPCDLEFIHLSSISGSLLVIHCVLDRVKHRGVRDKVGGLDKGQEHKQEVVDKLCIFS